MDNMLNEDQYGQQADADVRKMLDRINQNKKSALDANIGALDIFQTTVTDKNMFNLSGTLKQGGVNLAQSFTIKPTFIPESWLIDNSFTQTQTVPIGPLPINSTDTVQFSPSTSTLAAGTMFDIDKSFIQMKIDINIPNGSAYDPVTGSQHFRLRNCAGWMTIGRISTSIGAGKGVNTTTPNEEFGNARGILDSLQLLPNAYHSTVNDEGMLKSPQYYQTYRLTTPINETYITTKQGIYNARTNAPLLNEPTQIYYSDTGITTFDNGGDVSGIGSTNNFKAITSVRQLNSLFVRLPLRYALDFQQNRPMIFVDTQPNLTVKISKTMLTDALLTYKNVITLGDLGSIYQTTLIDPYTAGVTATFDVNATQLFATFITVNDATKQQLLNFIETNTLAYIQNDVQLITLNMPTPGTSQVTLNPQKFSTSDALPHACVIGFLPKENSQLRMTTQWEFQGWPFMNTMTMDINSKLAIPATRQGQRKYNALYTDMLQIRLIHMQRTQTINGQVKNKIVDFMSSNALQTPTETPIFADYYTMYNEAARWGKSEFEKKYTASMLLRHALGYFTYLPIPLNVNCQTNKALTETCPATVIVDLGFMDGNKYSGITQNIFNNYYLVAICIYTRMVIRTTQGTYTTIGQRYDNRVGFNPTVLLDPFA